MSESVYAKLRNQLDQYSIGYPATESGVEMKILKKLFEPEEAEMFLNLSLMVEYPESVAERSGLDVGHVSNLLEKMAEKGLIFRLRRGDKVKYGASAFVVGSYEYQLKNMDGELAELMDQYLMEGFDGAFAGGGSLLRPIPVNRSVDVKYLVATYDDSREILKKQKKIALADCICRKQQHLVGNDCKKPIEVCFVFGSHADYYISRDMAREISAEEAMKVLEQCEAAGLVTQPATARNPGGMCNCCGDCCGILRVLNKMEKPAEVVISNYYARVDDEACVGCEVCLDRCQMKAITMNEDGVAEINLDRCIGCGLCVTTCDAEAMVLELKPEEERREPPESAGIYAAELANVRGTTLEPLYWK